MCPELSSPAYGEVTVGYNVATYSCQYGYKLKGDKKRTCSYGVWSGSEPSCVKGGTTMVFFEFQCLNDIFVI